MTTVSVIIPVYNVLQWLDRCVDSVVGQSHHDLDIILVDDGSTDGSSEACDAWAARDARIRVFHQANAGLSVARNAGIAEARGDYVTYVDSDDWVHPNLIQELLAVATPTRITVTNFTRTTGETPPQAPPASPPTIWTQEHALDQLLGRHHTLLTVAWGKLFPASIAKSVLFPPRRFHEDEFTAHEFILLAQDVAVLSHPLYFYFTRESSIMASPTTAQRVLDAVDAAEKRAEAMSGCPPTLASVAWQEFCRKVLKGLAWTIETSDTEARRTLERSLRSIKSDRRTTSLPVPIRALIQIASRTPRLASTAIGLRARIGGAR